VFGMQVGFVAVWARKFSILIFLGNCIAFWLSIHPIWQNGCSSWSTWEYSSSSLRSDHMRSGMVTTNVHCHTRHLLSVWPHGRPILCLGVVCGQRIKCRTRRRWGEALLVSRCNRCWVGVALLLLRVAIWLRQHGSRGKARHWVLRRHVRAVAVGGGTGSRRRLIAR